MSSTNLSRRTILAGAASASALAVPVAAVAAPSLALAAAMSAVGDDRAAIVARAEQVVELLRTCHVTEGWQLDEPRAAAFLENLRQLDDEDGEALGPIIDWLSDHGQSLEWIFR